MNDCKQCEHSIVNMFGIGCDKLKDWITREEYKDGKKVLDNCPKKEKKCS